MRLPLHLPSGLVSAYPGLEGLAAGLPVGQAYQLLYYSYLYNICIKATTITSMARSQVTPGLCLP